jgi:predicted RNA-binding Zn-ribbon protein involved in translation (DUF1610 family)
MESAASESMIQREFPCTQCGAGLVFAPGSAALVCPHCGTQNQIDNELECVQESDYAAALAELAAGEELTETLTVKCSRCGAATSLLPNVTADTCPFCGAAIVAKAASRKLIRPRYLLPFHITREHALSAFRGWIASRWFAPSCLRQSAETGRLSGIYMPAWTYNCDTFSRYSGQRGDDYWVTEHYTAHENGRTVRKSRQVRKTRWTHVSGRVENRFCDLLVRASESLPEDYFHDLEPWDLANLVEYRNDYLAGFVCESYQIDLPTGFAHAKKDMEGPINQTICADIGGDHQRIDSVSTRYANITYKHLLLPVWLSAYRYRDRSYRFLVNARTGEVRGERPWSFWKITAAVLAALATIGLVVLLVNVYR